MILVLINIRTDKLGFYSLM